MDFRLTKEQDAFVAEVRRFLDQEMTDEIMREVASEERMGPHARAFLRKLGERGWLTVQWPRAWGGADRSPIDRFLLTEELAYRGAPGAFTSNTGGRIVGPVILVFGSEEQKGRFLPPIARGEIDFALGYTEPEAGSDLASLQMRAELDGDHYVITGQKLFNTGCHFAEYHWLAARTDPKAPKHKGISLFIVDLKSPGITIKPIWTMGGERTNAVYYDRVRVPRENLIGTPNAGFYILAKALEFERMFVTGDIRRFLDRLVEQVRSMEAGAAPALVRQRVAQLAIEIQVCRQLSNVVAWQMERGNSSGREASAVKLFKTELDQRLARTAMDVLGLYGQVQRGDPRAPGNGRFEHHYRRTVSATITGGTSEVQRNVIATRGLGLPR